MSFMDELGLTETQLAYLEWRYAVPRCCRVCGARLEVVDSRGMKMACTSDGASPFRPRYEAAGATRLQAAEHREKSYLYDPPDGDRIVLAAVAEIRRLRATETAASPAAGRAALVTVNVAGTEVQVVPDRERTIGAICTHARWQAGCGEVPLDCWEHRDRAGTLLDPQALPGQLDYFYVSRPAGTGG